MKYSVYFLYAYIFFSWITHSFGTIVLGMKGFNASNPFFRMTMGDLLGFFGIFIFLIAGANKKIYMPDSVKSVFLFLFLLLPGIFITPKPFSVFMEIFILFFMVLVAVLFVDQHRKEENFLKFLNLIVFTTLIAALVGIWDLIAGSSSLPFIFKPRRYDLDGTDLNMGLVGEAKSGFRNAGQAGTYFMMMITIIAPLRFSMLYNYLKRRQKIILNITLPLSIIFLVTTFKMAALLGLVVAVPLYAILFRKKGFILGILIFIGLSILIAPSVQTLAPVFYGRAYRKVTTRVLKYFMEEYDNENAVASTNFIDDNYSLALIAFTDKPLTGSGLGGFSGVYMSHEVHSTPMKLIGETGLLGILGYSIFMSLFLFHFVKIGKFNKLNPYRDFLLNMLPFIIGCFINWGYSFHPRKRAFWFVFTAVVIGYYLAVQWRKNNLKIKYDEQTDRKHLL